MISILLTLAMLVSVIMAVPLQVNAATEIPTYYLQYGGSGDGRSESAPAGTVAKVIISINSDGFTTGDEVVVKVMGYLPDGATTEPDLWKANGQGAISAPYIQYNTASSDVGHKATITITSYDPENKSRISMSRIPFNSCPANMQLCGPTIFDNISIIDGRSMDPYGRLIALSEFSAKFINTNILSVKSHTSGEKMVCLKYLRPIMACYWARMFKLKAGQIITREIQMFL